MFYPYCPRCEGYNINRIHRGLVRKLIFNVKKRYKCEDCHCVFTNKDWVKKSIS